MTGPRVHKDLYNKLQDVVEEFSQSDLVEGRNDLPTAWVLVVGYDYYDTDTDGMGGCLGIYPKDGCQANWKTQGILHSALQRYAMVDDDD